jgi:hypothetical protein
MAETEALRRQIEYVTAYLGGPECFDDWRQHSGNVDTLPTGGREVLETAAVVLSGFVEDHAERRGEEPLDVWSRWMLKLAAGEEA